MLLVQETHKEGHHLSHGETGGPKTLELKENGDPVGLSAGVGAVVLLVQETHKEGHHLSHEETGGPKTLELKANGELVGLSADVGIVVLPVQNSLKLTFKLVTILSQA